MRWPWISREVYELSLLNQSLERQVLIQKIEDLQQRIEEKEKLIQYLESIKVQSQDKPKSEQASPEPRKRHRAFSGGRGGWRHRSELESLSTLPTPSDSVQKLQQKVLKEGGQI